VAVSRNLDTISGYGIVNELIIFWGQLVQAFLNNMIAVQVLDKHYNMKAECNNDRMDLSIVSKISLPPG